MKVYEITYKEYHLNDWGEPELEDTDKRVKVRRSVSEYTEDYCKLNEIDMDDIVRREMVKEFLKKVEENKC